MVRILNKKLLLNQNKVLFDKLQIANLNLKRICEENSALKNEIEKLNEKIASLSDSSLIVTEHQTDAAEMELCDKNEDVNPVEVTPEDDISVPEFDAETEYASKVIGEIVIQAAKYSKILNESGKNNIKELMNLVLGKTEVAKVEIFNILSSEASFESKQEMIDVQLNDATEYFKSVIEQ